MSLCDAVSKIAVELESQLVDITASEQNRLNILKTMPDYLDRGCLDVFDKEYTNAYDDNENEDGLNFDMIELVSELAYENLYVGYSTKDSIRTYKAITKELKKHGINIPEDFDVSKW